MWYIRRPVAAHFTHLLLLWCSCLFLSLFPHENYSPMILYLLNWRCVSFFICLYTSDFLTKWCHPDSLWCHIGDRHYIMPLCVLWHRPDTFFSISFSTVNCPIKSKWKICWVSFLILSFLSVLEENEASRVLFCNIRWFVDRGRKADNDRCIALSDQQLKSVINIFDVENIFCKSFS